MLWEARSVNTFLDLDSLGRALRLGDQIAAPPEPLTPAETAHLLETTRQSAPRWYPWLLVALRTGLRLGELLALQWDDLDVAGRFLVVRRNLVRGVLTSPKSHQQRRVDLTPATLDVLVAWRRTLDAEALARGAPRSAWMFPSLTGGALEERNVRSVFARLLRRAGLRHRIHDLPYASQLLATSAPIPYLSRQLGHRDPATTLWSMRTCCRRRPRARWIGSMDSPTRNPDATGGSAGR